MFNFRLKVFNRSSKCRVFDEKVFNLIKNKIIKFPVYLSAGQEYVAATIAEICNLKKIKPMLFGQHRGHSIYISFNGNLTDLINEMLGKKNGCTYGMGGSLSIHSKKINMFGHDGFMGSNAPIAVGACLASNKPTIVFLGDAAVEEDYVLSSISWIAKKKLPILFVIEDNNFAVLTSKSERRDWNIDKVARSFNVKAIDVDDNPIKIYQKLKNYNFEEPFLINIRTNRLYWHSGAGKDNDTVFDRLNNEMKILGKRAKEIYFNNNKLINNLWNNLLERQ
jgi:pyruvate dehydrogenase E1 component alpha subunit